MPLFTLGKRSSTASAAAVAAGAAHHSRQSSISMSSSHDELAKVRAQTIAMANNGELTISRSKTSSGHTRSGHRSLHNYNSGHRPTGGPLYVTNRRQHIVVQEPDEDSSKHTKRIDQGILDASREASSIAANRQKEAMTQQQQPAGGSWWSSFAWSAAPNATTLDNASHATSLDARVSRRQQEGNLPVSSDNVLLPRKPTVVSKTFRVP